MPPRKELPADDDRDEAEVADKAAADKVRDRAAEIHADPEERVEIDVEAAEDELEGKLESAATRESRADRKRNRYREVQEREQAATRRAEDAERRSNEMQQILLRMQQTPQQPPAPPAEEPLSKELDNIFKEQDLLYRDYNARSAQMTPAEHEEFNRRGRDLQKRILSTSNKLTMKEMGIGRPPDEKQMRAAIFQQEMQVKHGDVMGDERRRMYADGVWRQMIAEGKPDDWDTMDECMERTRRKFGMTSRSRRPAPSESYKSKLVGSGRGAGPSSGGSGPTVVTMTKEYQMMADEAYRHIPDKKERYKRWAATVGKRLSEKQTSKTG